MFQKLTMRDACALMIIIQISKMVIFGFPGDAGNDTWISILLLLPPVLLLMLLYARLVRLMPGKGLYEMTESALGRIPSIILTVLYVYYFLTLSGIVHGNYVEFVHLVSLYNTSFVIVCIAFFIICSFLAYSGSETLGKWAFAVMLFSLAVFAVMLYFSAPTIKPDNIMPVLDKEWSEIGRTSFLLFAQPFGEAVVLLCVIGDMEKKANPYKLFLTGGLISIVIGLGVYFFVCAMLGQEGLHTAYFPAYKAASIIHIGTVGTRVEALIAFAFLFQKITKAAICLIAAVKGVASIFKVSQYWKLVHTVGFMSVAFSTFIFHNIIEMFDFFDNIYPLYAPFFQVIIPLVIWIAAEIKARRSPSFGAASKPA